MWPGDVFADDVINMKDIMVLGQLFNSISGDGKYSAAADINKNGVINLEDVMLVSKNFNKGSKDYKNEIDGLS